MANIVIKNLNNTNVTYQGGTVLQAIQQAGIDWMHACGAKGRCTTCKMVVVEGAQYLSADSPAEVKYRSQGRLGPHERLTCQCQTNGPLIIVVPKSGQFPHMVYTL